MRRIGFYGVWAALALTCCRAPAPPAAASKPEVLRAQAFQSNFPLARHTYNGLSAASDGRIYYALSSSDLDTGGRMFVYDPAAGAVEAVGDLTEACGEKDRKAIPQGKSHVPFFEADGKLYFATHAGYYTLRDGRERMANPPPAGYRPYPGGHFLAFDLKTRTFTDLAKAPGGQGILTMTMDPARRRLYGLTWPDGYFLRFDLRTSELKNLGRVSARGEAGEGSTYRSLCRAMVADPRDGAVYLTTAEGTILRYRYDRDALETVAGDDLRKDYFGIFDPAKPGHMGYHWRQAVWYGADNVIYAVHGNSGYLFRFDPRAERVELLGRLTALPSRRAGMFDKFYYGYLGFTLGPDGRTLYYLTGGVIWQDGKPLLAREAGKLGAQGEENLHLVTWDIPEGRYRDHGPILLPGGIRPSWINSIAVGRDGAVYAVAGFQDGGRERTDLIRVAPVRP